MGRNNKQRRAAKARARARSAGGSQGRATPPRGGFGAGAAYGDPFGSPGPGWHDDGVADPDQLAVDLLKEVVLYRVDTGVTPPRALQMLTDLPTSAVDRATETLLLDVVDMLWQRGWQPAEVHRQGRRGCSIAAGGRLVAHAIATDHVGRRSTTLDHRWVAQTESLDLPASDGRPGWVGRWVQTEQLHRDRAAAAIVEVLADLYGLPRLDPILPPPGSSATSVGPTEFIDLSGAEADPVLQRIRALLAQAESTTFEAEAETFTAKAQELMTRHAVDAAIVAAGSSRSGDAARPVTVRLPVDAPYVDAKSLLLQIVASATRCRSVFHADLGLSTVVGFPDDVAAVELLFTSLLLQAQRALAEAAAGARAGTRQRGTSFRSAFLLAYAQRIGQRLEEVNQAVYAEAERAEGPAFLPALRSREAAVDDAVEERFGELTSSRVRGGYDGLGWASGTAAADRARLNSGDLEAEPEAAVR